MPFKFTRTPFKFIRTPFKFIRTPFESIRTCSVSLYSSQSPEIRKYKRKFNGEILCGALWGVNLLVGTDNGLLLLDRSGHGKGES